LLTAEASKILGRPIVVESRVGAGGALAAEAVARSRPDGQTILLASSANTILPAMSKTLRYDALNDFEWVVVFARYPLVVAVNAKSPAQTLADLLQSARAAPAGLSFGTPGNGTAPHLVTEILASTTGVKFLHVPYKGEALAMVDLMGGQIDFSLLTGPTALPRVKTGELRALAVTTATRWKALPQVPTVAESGYPSYNLSSWLGLAVAKGTPMFEVDRLFKAYAQSAQLPDIQRQLESRGIDPAVFTPAETFELAKKEVRQWQDLATTSGLRPE
jgi:tripartite-type tricarboxylate transporter receptor subunit TctC